MGAGTSGMAGRYAKALAELARESGELARVEQDLGALSEALRGSEALQRLVSSPLFSAQDQQAGLDAVFGQVGFSQITVNFLGLLARNRRLGALAEIIRAFHLIMAAERGELAAEVSSAAPLSTEQVERLKQSIREAFGRDVTLKARVDPSLIGGLVVKVGSRMIDNSVKTKLNNLKIAMKEVG